MRLLTPVYKLHCSYTDVVEDTDPHYVIHKGGVILFSCNRATEFENGCEDEMNCACKQAGFLLFILRFPSACAPLPHCLLFHSRPRPFKHATQSLQQKTIRIVTTQPQVSTTYFIARLAFLHFSPFHCAGRGKKETVSSKALGLSLSQHPLLLPSRKLLPSIDLLDYKLHQSLSLLSSPPATLSNLRRNRNPHRQLFQLLPPCC